RKGFVLGEEVQMKLQDAVRIAVRALGGNKLRAGLAVLGMVIGVGAVIALVSVGNGSQKAVQDQILGLGSNLLFIRPGSTSVSGVQGGAGSAQTLSASDSDAIAASIAEAVAVVPQANA